MTIKLRIKSPKEKDNPSKPLRADYTFMYDWFGDTFKYIRTEESEPYDDIVEVKCSPYVHDSQAAIPLMQMASERATILYDLADSAYDAEEIRAFSEKLGHVPASQKRR